MMFTEISIMPDFEALKANLLRRGTPKRVHFLELHQDQEVKDLIVERYDLARGLNPAEVAEVSAADTVELDGQAKARRYWANEHQGPITSWEDFEKYPWPDLAAMDLSALDWAEQHLDPAMRVSCSCHSLSEYVTFFFGYEPLCSKILLEPDLVAAAYEKIGQIQLKKAQILCDYNCIGMLFGGDDMGFKTGLLLPKDVLAKHSFPWYKRIVEAAHRKDKPFLLHSCGQIESIMEELIEDVKIDGRHSFEDVITPVTEAKRTYGERLAIIGGIDIGFLATASAPRIRERVRQTLDVCQPGGGYCLGTGNSVPNYIPLDHYLAMLDEGRRYGV